MQDKAIAAIGELQLEKNKDLEEVDLYIECITKTNYKPKKYINV